MHISTILEPKPPTDYNEPRLYDNFSRCGPALRGWLGGNYVTCLSSSTVFS